MFAVEVSNAGMFGQMHEFDLVILPDQAAVDHYLQTAVAKLGVNTIASVPANVEIGPVIETHVNHDNEVEVTKRKSTEGELMRSSALRWHQSMFLSVKPKTTDGSELDVPAEMVLYRLSVYNVLPTTEFRKPSEWHPDDMAAAAAEEAKKAATASGSMVAPAPATMQ